MAYTPAGRPYFIDHSTKTTTFQGLIPTDLSNSSTREFELRLALLLVILHFLLILLVTNRIVPNLFM